jgi:hypothetical protein
MSLQAIEGVAEEVALGVLRLLQAAKGDEEAEGAAFAAGVEELLAFKSWAKMDGGRSGPCPSSQRSGARGRLRLHARRVAIRGPVRVRLQATLGGRTTGVVVGGAGASPCCRNPSC